MRRAIEESKASAEAEEAARKQADDAAVEEAKRAEEKAKKAAAAKAKREAKEQAKAQAAAQAQAQAANQAFANSGLPNLGASGAGGGSSLPSIESALPGIGGHKPKSTGLALFDEIEINADDAAEVQEEKSQRIALKE